MNAPSQQTEQDYCPNCTKAGLPLLPLRYAVARNDSKVKAKAPVLAAPFGEGIHNIALPEELARYTLRTLRAGFLYVFNEKRGTWSAYEVEDDGRLLEFPFLDKSPPPVDEDAPKAVCSRHGDPSIAKCIIIKDAHKAGNLWLSFTTTAWTPALKQLHRQRAYREKHMRRIDLAQWVGGQGLQTQPHLESLSQAKARVAEFNVPPTPVENSTSVAEGEVMLPTLFITSYRAYAFSLVRFISCANDQESFLLAAQQTGERGKTVAGSHGPYPPGMVALDDPSGIAMDLASLMNERLAEFMLRSDIRRPLTVSTAIGSLEEAIRNNAELELVRTVRDKAALEQEYWRKIAWKTGEGPVDPVRYQAETQHQRNMRDDPSYRAEWGRKVDQAQEAALAQLTEQDFQDAADSAWAKYHRKLQDGQPGKWQKGTYQPELKAFDKAVIVPLSRAHVAWLTSDKMRMYMVCNHDPEEPASGVAYCDTVLLCIQDTQAISINAAQYAKWLSAATVDDGNLLLRAISLNQAKVVEALSSGSGITIDGLATMPWGSLLDGYSRALEQLPASQQSTPARLLVAVAGPLMTALDMIVHQGARPLVIGLGLVGRTPVVHTRLRGTLDQAIDDLVDRMVRANPELGQLDRDRLRTRLRNQSAGQRRTTRARGPGTRGMNDFQIVVRQLAVEEVTGRMSEREQLRRAGQAVMSFDEWQRSSYSRWRTMTQGINGSIVGVLLSVWSLKSLAKALDESTQQAGRENKWRYSAAILGVVAAVSDGLHRVLENARQAGSRLATRMNELWGRLLGVVGRAFGFAAAVIFAFWDAKNSFDSFGRGEVGMGILYAVSGSFSVLAFAALAGWLGPLIFGLSATGVGIVLAAIAIAAAVLIAWLKDDKLEAWMRRCWFGTAGEGGFKTQEEEMAELDALLKAGD